MKLIFSFLRALLALGLWLGSGPAARAQAPAWQMAVAIGDDSQTMATAADANGNVYVAGYFSGTAGFGSLLLTNTGGPDAFVAKWSRTTGTFVWARQAGGGAGGVVAYALAVNGASIYVTGQFGGTASFGVNSLSSAFGNDVFVAKLTDAGTSAAFDWVQGGGGSGNDYANAVAVSGTSVYVAGNFDGPTASFGGTTLVNPNTGGSTPGGGTSFIADIFVVKLVDAGGSASFAGALRAGGTQNDVASGLAVNGASVYLVGLTNSIFPAFGSLTMRGGGGLNDLFVAKLTDAAPMGSFVWAVSAGGADNDGAAAVAVTGTSVYVTGKFAGGFALFDGIRLNNPNAQGMGTVAYVAKLTDAGTSGSFTWAQRLGSGSYEAQGLALAVRGPSLYVAGTFVGTASFGSTVLTSAGYEDVFVAKIADAGPAGVLAWTQQAGGPRSDFPYALAATGAGVFVAGSFQFPTASFGPIALALASASSTSAGFLAALPDADPLAAAPARPAASIALFPNPAHGRATVQLPNSAGPATLTLLDVLGRTLRTHTTPTNAKAELDLAGLAPGLYAVRVSAGTSTATQRLVVE